ncbi:MAG: hypothetical protein QM805_07280 [Pseudomonas sp.]
MVFATFTVVQVQPGSSFRIFTGAIPLLVKGKTTFNSVSAVVIGISISLRSKTSSARAALISTAPLSSVARKKRFADIMG